MELWALQLLRGENVLPDSLIHPNNNNNNLNPLSFIEWLPESLIDA
jgi:hypothetical protein